MRRQAQATCSRNPSIQAVETSFEATAPSNPPTVSSRDTVGYIGDSGFLSVFHQEHRNAAAIDDPKRTYMNLTGSALPPVGLQQGFIETYLEYCWPWCPVVDKEDLAQKTGAKTSPLLANALALLGTQIQPPLVQHATAEEYYTRAKILFYTDEEKDPIVCLQSIVLFYWWAPRAPSTINKDGAWWWTGLGIKYAQQMGMHREPDQIQGAGGSQLQGLRRRIWWTLFVGRSFSYCRFVRSRPILPLSNDVSFHHQCWPALGYCDLSN